MKQLALSKTKMIKHFVPAIMLTLIMTLLTGLAFPLAMTGVAGRLFPYQANGSLIERDGKIIGSELIGQNFTSGEPRVNVLKLNLALDKLAKKS